MSVSDEFVIRDVQIFTGRSLIPTGYVHVKDGFISSFGDLDSMPETLASIMTVSRLGDTLSPGLIDAHIHALGGNVHSIEQSLRFGVTTVCDMQNDPKDNARIKKVCLDFPFSNP